MLATLEEQFADQQARAAQMLSDCELMRVIAESDAGADNEDTRVAGFLARHWIRYASQRASDALRLPRQDEGVPLVEPDDFGRFVERCTRIAGEYRIDARLVGDSLLGETELALHQARLGLVRAEQSYVQQGPEQAARILGIAKTLGGRPDGKQGDTQG